MTSRACDNGDALFDAVRITAGHTAPDRVRDREERPVPEALRHRTGMEPHRRRRKSRGAGDPPAPHRVRSRTGQVVGHTAPGSHRDRGDRRTVVTGYATVEGP